MESSQNAQFEDNAEDGMHQKMGSAGDEQIDTGALVMSESPPTYNIGLNEKFVVDPSQQQHQ